MGLLTKNVLGIQITTSAKGEVLEEIEKYLKELRTKNLELRTKKVKPLIIFTPNPEIITYAQKDPIFKRIVNSAQINIPDGVGVSWAIKKLYGVDVERISGADLMEGLCFWASENGARIGLIGGRDRLALQALECLRKKYPKLDGWAMDGPEIKISKKHSDLGISDTEMRSIINKIIKEGTDILFVALGFPKQEYFIAQLAQTLHRELRTKNGDRLKDKSLVHRSKFSVPIVLMAVGGSFDYLAGSVSRAPEWVRERGLEWLYRLIREPWRVLRQLRGAEFFFRILTNYSHRECL